MNTDTILNNILYSEHHIKNDINIKIKNANNMLKTYSIRELLFSSCPELKYFIRFNDLNIFFSFFDYIYNNKNFNEIWKLPIFFFKFLEINNIVLNERINIELISLATSQWTYADKTLNRYIFIISNKLSKNIIIYSKKINSIYKEREVYLLDSHTNIQLSENAFFYKTFTEFPYEVKLHEFNKIPV